METKGDVPIDGQQAGSPESNLVGPHRRKECRLPKFFMVGSHLEQ